MPQYEDDDLTVSASNRCSSFARWQEMQDYASLQVKQIDAKKALIFAAALVGIVAIGILASHGCIPPIGTTTVFAVSFLAFLIAFLIMCRKQHLTFDAKLHLKHMELQEVHPLSSTGHCWYRQHGASHSYRTEQTEPLALQEKIVTS